MYELLLEKGPTKPSDLVEPSGLGRGNVYNVLQQLVAQGLVQLREQAKFQTYEAVDPTQLRSLLERKQAETKRLESVFLSTLPQLTSTFNLTTGKPAIQMFEGLSGMESALLDSLQAKNEILTYFDPEAMTSVFADMNKSYIKQRIKAEVKKRILLPSSEQSKHYKQLMQNAWTDIRLVTNLTMGFGTAVEIYNDKVSFHTLNPEQPMAFIVENSAVAAFHRALFQAQWATASA